MYCAVIIIFVDFSRKPTVLKMHTNPLAKISSFACHGALMVLSPNKRAILLKLILLKLKCRLECIQYL